MTKFKNNKSYLNNIIYIILLCICVFITSVSIYYCYKNHKIYKFNSDIAMSYTKYLSSDELEGRLPGTEGNIKACNYIENHFKSLGLEPFESSYRHSFGMEYPKFLNFDPVFSITKDGKTSDLKYAEDYFDTGTNYDINEVNFTSKDILKSSDLFLIVTKDDKYIYLSANDPINKRFSYTKDFKYDLCISLSFDAFKNLVNDINNGASINIHIPFIPKNTTADNILGYIKGKDSSKGPIIFSCHLDHVGKDALGNIFPGALDNASGTGFLMEFAKYVKSLGTPNRDILFVAFNGEDSGLLGSTAFVSDYLNKLDDTVVYNFDMIGGTDNSELLFMGSENDTKDTTPIDSLSKIAEKEKTYFNYEFKPASDHEPFRLDSIPAVTFCDNDTTRIHQPLDTIDFINPKFIDRTFSIISKEINNKYYTNNMLYQYPLVFTILGSISSVILIIFIINNNKNNVI